MGGLRAWWDTANDRGMDITSAASHWGILRLFGSLVGKSRLSCQSRLPSAAWVLAVVPIFVWTSTPHEHGAAVRAPMLRKNAAGGEPAARECQRWREIHWGCDFVGLGAPFSGTAAVTMRVQVLPRERCGPGGSVAMVQYMGYYWATIMTIFHPYLQSFVGAKPCFIRCLVISLVWFILHHPGTRNLLGRSMRVGCLSQSGLHWLPWKLSIESSRVCTAAWFCWFIVANWLRDLL